MTESRLLVTHMYAADPRAHVFEGKLFVYPSHDIDAGIAENDDGDHFAMRDYHVLSLEEVDGEVDARVRVRVFRGALREHEPEPVAIGYLGHDAHDLAAYEVPNPLRELRAKGRALLASERAQRARAAARKAARDPRVGYGSAAVLAVLAGWALTRRFRGRRHLS